VQCRGVGCRREDGSLTGEWILYVKATPKFPTAITNEDTPTEPLQG